MPKDKLKERCKRVLYSIYDNSLEEEQKEIFDTIKETDLYLNQIVDEVMHYVTYDLPLKPIILEKMRGDKHA